MKALPTALITFAIWSFGAAALAHPLDKAGKPNSGGVLVSVRYTDGTVHHFTGTPCTEARQKYLPIKAYYIYARQVIPAEGDAPAREKSSDGCWYRFPEGKEVLVQWSRVLNPEMIPLDWLLADPTP